MKAGLWIDHRRAVVATVVGRNIDYREFLSGEEDLVKHMGATCDVRPEDHRDRRIMNHLNHYYDGIVAALRDAEEILVMGPGEAKTEFAARLEHAGLKSRLAGVRPADKMSDRQVVAMVRDRFVPKRRRAVRGLGA